MKIYFQSLLASLFLFSCVENETPDPQALLDGEVKITVSPIYVGLYNEVWVILHDLDGKPIESQKVVSGQTLTVKLDDSQRYHLTTYRKSESRDYKVEFLETFTDIEVHEDLTLGLFKYTEPDPVFPGEFEVNITGPETPFDAYLSSKSGFQQSHVNRTGGQIQIKSPFVSGPGDYLLVARTYTGESRYKFFNVPVAGTKLSYSFSELSAFDRVLKFPKSNYGQFYYSSVALTKTNDDLVPGYLINSNREGMGFDPLNAHEMGFLNSVENYEIYITGNRAQGSKTSFSYKRIGTVPTAINLPQDVPIQVAKDKPSEFQLSLPAGNTEWIATWDQSEPFTGTTQAIVTLRWIVFGSKPSLKLELPKELTEGIPKLRDLGKFRLESVQVTTSTIAYDRQIRNRLVELPKKEPMESVTVRQSF